MNNAKEIEAIKHQITIAEQKIGYIESTISRKQEELTKLKHKNEKINKDFYEKISVSLTEFLQWEEKYKNEVKNINEEIMQLMQHKEKLIEGVKLTKEQLQSRSRQISFIRK